MFLLAWICGFKRYLMNVSSHLLEIDWPLVSENHEYNVMEYWGGLVYF